MATARPARSRRVSPDVEEEEEPTTTARRAPREEDEEETPRRRTRAVQNEEDVEPDDDEEETAIPFQRGRKAIRDARPTPDSMYFRWPKESGEVQVVKFLDEEPWGYQQHWVQRAGKQSFPCLGKGCPLCAVGVKTTSKVIYDIVNLSLADGPAVQAFEVTSTLDDELAALDEGKSGPLPRLWWAVSRTNLPKPKGYQKYKYVFTPIKDRDLDEDYEINLDEAEDAISDAKPLDPEKVLGKISKTMLQDIADEIMD